MWKCFVGHPVLGKHKVLLVLDSTEALAWPSLSAPPPSTPALTPSEQQSPLLGSRKTESSSELVFPIQMAHSSHLRQLPSAVRRRSHPGEVTQLPHHTQSSPP